MDKSEIQNEIDRITEFTCSYYYPLFEESQKRTMETPLMSEIIWNTIKIRSDYVEKLKRILLLTN